MAEPANYPAKDDSPMNYTVIIKYDPEDQIWYAHLEEEPRAHTFGKTREQALAFAADLPVLWYGDDDATIMETT